MKIGMNTPWEEINYYLKHHDETLSDDFCKWLGEHDDNYQLWQELTQIYSLTGEVPEFFEPDTDSAWKKIEKRTLSSKKIFKLKQLTMRVAASLLLFIVGAASYYTYQELSLSKEVYTEVFSPYGHKTLVLLPDSTKVWLNGNTKLRYESSFRKNRRVELSGEALFDVSKDENKHFIVESEHLQTKVYGTTFNFKAYPEELKNEVALVEGSLAVFYKGQKLHHMQVNDLLTFFPGQKTFKVEKGDMSYVTAWSGGELVIDNEEISSVVKYLERWYGVEVELIGSKVTEQKISFKLKTESLNEFLPVLARIIPMEYEVDGKKVVINLK